jgi:hypothetical protein
MDVASRADLKSDLLKELERHKAQLNSYRGNPSISEAALDEVVTRIDHAFNGLNQLNGKAGHTLTANEWLMSIRSRINIPGGTCEFDLPPTTPGSNSPRQAPRRPDAVDDLADAAGRGAAGAAGAAARLGRAAQGGRPAPASTSRAWRPAGLPFAAGASGRQPRA